MLNLVQKGSGTRRILCVAYLVADHAALRSALPASSVIVTDIDNEHARFSKAPGRGGVDAIASATKWAQQQAGAFEVSALVLIGWSAGCQALRSQMQAGVLPDAVLAIDGVSGSVPPTEAQMAPWRVAAERARRGQTLLVLSHSLNTYTEDLPPNDRFLSTLSGCRLVTGWPLEEAGPPVNPVITAERGLVVASYASARVDKAAHLAQQNVAMPDLLRRIVLPWLEHPGAGDRLPPSRPAESQHAPTTPPTARLVLRRGSYGPEVAGMQELLTRAGYPTAADGVFGPKTEAAVKHLQGHAGLPASGIVGVAERTAAEARAAAREPRGRSSLGLRALHIALGELGQHEVPGPAANPRIAEYLSGCERGGHPLGLVGDEPAWCAAFVGWCEHHAAYEGEALPPWRAAVAELWQDAKTIGKAHGLDYSPKPGDLAIYSRAGGDPRRGGPGHVARVKSATVDGVFTACGGNEDDAVRLTDRRLDDPRLVGWIER